MEYVKSLGRSEHLHRMCLLENYPRKICRSCFLWPETHGLPDFCGFSFVLVYCSFINYVHFRLIFHEQFGNIDAMVASASTLPLALICEGRLINLMFRRARLIKMLNELRFQSWPLNWSPKNDVFYKKVVAGVIFLVQWYLGACMIGVILWFFFPIDPGDIGQRKMPIVAWYPLDIDRSPYFEITYAALFVAAIFLVGLIAGYSAMYILIFVCIWFQFKFLSEALFSINKKKSGKSEEEVYQDIRFYINQHKFVFKTWIEFVELFRINALWELFVTEIIFSVLFFSIRVGGDAIVQAKIIVYIICMTFNVSLYAISGTILETESINIANSAYNCDWQDLTKKNRLALLLIIINAQRVLYLDVPLIGSVNNTTLSGLYKTAFTVSTMLLQAKKQKQPKT